MHLCRRPCRATAAASVEIVGRGDRPSTSALPVQPVAPATTTPMVMRFPFAAAPRLPARAGRGRRRSAPATASRMSGRRGRGPAGRPSAPTTEATRRAIAGAGSIQVTGHGARRWKCGARNGKWVQASTIDVGALALALDEGRLDLGPDGGIVDRLAAHGGLGERREIGRADEADMAMAGELLDERAGVVALHGAEGAEHADRPERVCSAAGLIAGTVPTNGSVWSARSGWQHQRRGGVAGDHHRRRLDDADEPADERDDVLGQRRLLPVAIGKGGIVGDIDDLGAPAAPRGSRG